MKIKKERKKEERSEGGGNLAPSFLPSFLRRNTQNVKQCFFLFFVMEGGRNYGIGAAA